MRGIFIELLEKAAGVESVLSGRRESLMEVVRVLKVKADKYDAIVAEARSAPLRKNQ